MTKSIEEHRAAFHHSNVHVGSHDLTTAVECVLADLASERTEGARFRKALETMRHQSAEAWCHAEDCERTCREDDAPCDEHGAAGCPGCDCGVSRVLTIANEALGPRTVDVARGDELTLMGRSLGVDRELDEAFRARCKAQYEAPPGGQPVAWAEGKAVEGGVP